MRNEGNSNIGIFGVSARLPACPPGGKRTPILVFLGIRIGGRSSGRGRKVYIG